MMATKKRLIDANALIKDWNELTERMVRDADGKIPVDFGLVIRELSKTPTVDAVEVIRCKDCQHGVFDEEKGIWKCVESAEWDEDMGDWLGFVVYHPRDFYCANGERKDNEDCS